MSITSIVVSAIVAGLVVFIGIPLFKFMFYMSLAKKYGPAIEEKASILIYQYLQGYITEGEVKDAMEWEMIETFQHRYEPYQKAVVAEVIKRLPMAVTMRNGIANSMMKMN